MDICPCNICPGDICPYQQYLSCYWPDFDQILKVGSWDLFEHILTVTFVQAIFVLATFVHIYLHKAVCMWVCVCVGECVCNAFLKTGNISPIPVLMMPI